LSRPDVDVDAHGYPKAPIEESSQEQLFIQEEKRQEVLARQPQIAHAVPEPGAKLSDVVCGHMTSEDYDDLAYPKLPP